MEEMKQGLHIAKDGVKRWYRNDKFHREDGPAIEYGYAVLNGNGEPCVSYYINGTYFMTIERWAAGMLRWREEVVTDEVIQNFLRPILQKQTAELL